MNICYYYSFIFFLHRFHLFIFIDYFYVEEEIYTHLYYIFYIIYFASQKIFKNISSFFHRLLVILIIIG
nr:MAG TPA: hypothetical protein [Caudoviricetes sp.]